MADETQPENTQEENGQEEENGSPGEMVEVGTYAVGGAAAGAGMSTLGGIKLAVAGTVVANMFPIVALGAVTGVAAYGLKKAFWDK